MTKTKIKELFASIQGEGPYIGYNQLFIRFCGCNLNCQYCDTDFDTQNNYTEYAPSELIQKIKADYDLTKIHSISLTGGEPLLSADFLKEFLPLIGKKIYLETNATLPEQLIKVKDLISIIAADIKLESSTGIKGTYKMHDEFFKQCTGVETFAKIVFNENFSNSEIVEVTKLARKYNIPLVLQPEMNKDKIQVSSNIIQTILDKCLNEYKNVRVIPQSHKFMGIE
ncbi:MAG: 7-carboxy-7-deazaguanine synthase QueE [Clostridiaceae bacterium]|jgi:7-carboxy-7-deazaguanine synthase|nr:7-carboxy-7-deazaguanine synthase QueE [Clostridiaceae bacterium]